MSVVRWTHQTDRAEEAVVLPDGCRDIILRAGPGLPLRAVQTGLDLVPRRVMLGRKETLTGYRMPPGRVLSEDLIRGATCPDHLAEIARQPHGTDEIEALVDLFARPGATLAGVARAAGVSPRSLQRQLARAGQPSPDHWIGLARARRAARALSTGEPLAQIAADAGYADQPHMTRAFRRWFGVTPGRLRRAPELLAQLSQPGLGGWTTEQISIR